MNLVQREDSTSQFFCMYYVKYFGDLKGKNVVDCSLIFNSKNSYAGEDVYAAQAEAI